MARIPKPPSMHRLAGNPGKRPHRSAGRIAPVKGTPAAPKGLGSTGRAAWQRIWAGAHWLTPVDAPIITMLVEYLDTREQCRAVVEKEGRTALGSQGQPVAHPLMGTIHALSGDIFALLDACGLTPVSRARLHIETAAPEPLGALEEWLLSDGRIPMPSAGRPS